MLDQKTLKELLHYDPETGLFTWLPRRLEHFKSTGTHSSWNKQFSNRIAGSKTTGGYILIVVKEQQYYAHRLAFLYMDGSMPPNEVDHIDGGRSNNKWGNLRLATRSDNSKNLKLFNTSTTGHPGVYWHKDSKKWYAKIKLNGKQSHLGMFNKLDDAVRARKEAEIDLGFHPNHGRVN